MEDSIRVEFEMEQKMCSSCKKNSSEYYELKLQVRFSYFNNIDEVRKEIFDLITKNFEGINKVDELDQGIDMFFKSYGEMNKICALFSRKYFIEEKRTKKIVGHNFLESKDIWRHTLLINVINLKKNDKISVRGEDYYIKAFNKKELVLRKLDDGSKYVIRYSVIKDYLKILEN